MLNCTRAARLMSLLASLLGLFGAGCGTSVYRPAALAGFQLDSAAEIDDAAIGQAFEAKPQLRTPTRIAYLVFGDERADEIGQLLRGLPGVTDVYRIPELLATGQRATFSEPEMGGYSRGYAPQQALSMKALRLLAARAHCDLLLVVDYGHSQASEPNALVALNVLLLPTFFVPFLDTRVSSGLEAYLFDVRNGYLYAQISGREKGRSGYLTIYRADEEEERLLAEQWDALRRATATELVRTLQPAPGPAPAPTPPTAG